MAKLTRQQQQVFAGQAPSDMIAAFGSTQTGSPVYSTDLSTLQTANYQQGWQNAIIADKAPFLEEMNGVQYGLSYQIAYNQQMGIPEWLSTQDYYTNSRAIGSDGNVYKSLTDDNIGNNPVLDDGTNWVLDKIPEANVLNYITNCMLSTPNGLPSYSGNTVTVYELTQFLFANGRNSNNQILNVNFALASNATGTITKSYSGDYIAFITSELEVEFIPTLNYYITNTEPTTLNVTPLGGIWYNPDTNILQSAVATSSTPVWATIEAAPFAMLNYNGTSITSFKTIYPAELLKRSDKEEITSWSSPSSNYVALQLGSSGDTYTALADGYFTFCRNYTTNQQHVGLACLAKNLYQYSHASYAGGGTIGVVLKVSKGDEVKATFSATGPILAFGFVYSEGANND